MKSFRLIVAASLALNASHAAPFINLDFEGIDTNSIGGYPFPQGGQASIQVAMPGWSVNGLTNGAINFNDGCGDFYCNAFITREAFNRHLKDTTLAYHYFPNGLHGNYGLGLAPQFDFPGTLSQRGDVPAEANYLAVDAQISATAYVLAYLDGVRVTDQFINATNSTNISVFAGKTVNLDLVFFAVPQSPGPSQIPSTIGLDGIAFLHLATPQIDTRTSRFDTNGFAFSWQAEATARFQPELATNLPPVWQAVGSVITSTNGNFTFTDTKVATNKTVAQRFYRLRSLPP